VQPPSPTGQLGGKLDHKARSALKSGVFTMLGYPSLDTASLSEITSPYNKSKPVIINITNATTAELRPDTSRDAPMIEGRMQDGKTPLTAGEAYRIALQHSL
jgi:hypothetical protein